MSEAEKKLKYAVNNLFHVVRMNGFMKKASCEFDELLETSDYALKMFEDPSRMQTFVEAKDFFDAMLKKVKTSFGSDAISAAYNAFKEALENDEFLAYR